jgi:ABC-type antimicrobial peptide transport system permease subunit
VIAEGLAMACAGLAVGLVSGYALAQLAGSYLPDLKMPGFLPVASSAFILLLAAVIGSVIPAARAARVDVLQALRTE